jgi:hypothetical protein
MLGIGHAKAAVRALLGGIGGVGQDVEEHVPGEAKIQEAAEALHRTAESLDRHVEALGALADSLPELTTAVTRLSEQLSTLLSVTAPMAAAEREMEAAGHELSSFERLFHRRRPASAGPERGAAPVPPTPPPAARVGGSGNAPR